MPRGGKYSHTLRAPGTIITDEIYNEDHQQHIDNLYPEMIDAFSDTVDMFDQDNADPYNEGQANRPTTLAGEIERLRYRLKKITGLERWYLPNPNNLSDIAENFTSTSAPDPNEGQPGSLWIRQDGTTLEVYQRGVNEWPATPRVSLTSGRATGVNLTASSSQLANSVGQNGDIHLQFAGNEIVFWEKSSGTWSEVGRFDGANILSGAAAPGQNTGQQGDLYVRVFGSTMEIYRKTSATVWTRQTTTQLETTNYRFGTAVPANSFGVNGDVYIRMTATSVVLYTKSSGSWGVTHTVQAPAISSFPLVTFNAAEDFIAVMDGGTGGTPNARIRGSDLVTALTAGVSSIPVGVITAFGGTTAPGGWLLCRGQAVSRNDFAGLYAVIGATYGSGDGSTTFNLPDLRRRVPVGAGGTGTPVLGNSPGNRGGSERHTLTVGEMPAHQHGSAGSHSHPSGGSHTHTLRGSVSSAGSHRHTGSAASAGSHSHSIPSVDSANRGNRDTGLAQYTERQTLSYSTSTGGSHTHSLSIGSAGSHTHSLSGSAASAGSHTHGAAGSHQHGSVGSGQAHNNMQPSIVLNYIIKV